MNAEIITIGNEVLRGEVDENNAVFLSRRLSAEGFIVERITVIPDDVDTVADELRAASGRCRVLLVTGGLGPTIDDITKDAAIRAFDLETEVRDAITKEIEERLRVFGKDIPPGYRDQGRIPAGARVLSNEVGLAVGFSLHAGRCDVYLLPGVPAEMRAMFEEHTLPVLRGMGCGTGPPRLRTFGSPETEIEEIVRGQMPLDLFRRCSIISGTGGVDLYLPREAASGNLVDRLRCALGTRLYAEGDVELEEAALTLLHRRGATLAVAESFTGGLVASRLVSLPGASESLLEGVIAYGNRSKIDRLGVTEEALAANGAVSAEVCVQMARGIRESARADYGLATTGIAGPGGATALKPVGLCFNGLAGPEGEFCIETTMPGTREMIRRRGASIALDMLRLSLDRRIERLRPYRVEG